MEEFHAERHGNLIDMNREPQTEAEYEYLGLLIEEAMGYAFISGKNPYIMYPEENNDKNSR